MLYARRAVKAQEDVNPLLRIGSLQGCEILILEEEWHQLVGVLRGREFTMKDSYSFDMTDEGLDESYGRHRKAYQNIFNRLEIDYAICKATSGAMGGSASEEFLAVSEVGEEFLGGGASHGTRGGLTDGVVNL